MVLPMALSVSLFARSSRPPILAAPCLALFFCPCAFSAHFHRSQNVWNCAWSSVQGLVRATPACFASLDPSLQDQIKKFIREIVDTGYDAGLLSEDMTQYPGGELMGDRAEVAEHCWTKVSDLSLRYSGQCRKGYAESGWLPVDHDGVSGEDEGYRWRTQDVPPDRRGVGSSNRGRGESNSKYWLCGLPHWRRRS